MWNRIIIINFFLLIILGTVGREFFYFDYNSFRRVREADVYLELRRWLGNNTNEFISESDIEKYSTDIQKLILSNVIKLFEINFAKLRDHFLEVSKKLPEEKKLSRQEAEEMALDRIRRRTAQSLMRVIGEEDNGEEIILYLEEARRMERETEASFSFGASTIFSEMMLLINDIDELRRGYDRVIEMIKKMGKMGNMGSIILNTIIDFYGGIDIIPMKEGELDRFLEDAEFSLEMIEGLEEMGEKYYRPLITIVMELIMERAIPTVEEFKRASRKLKELYTILSQNSFDDIEILKLHFEGREVNPYYEYWIIFTSSPVSRIFSDLYDSIETIEELEQIIKGAIEIAKQGKDPTPYLKSFITRD